MAWIHSAVEFMETPTLVLVSLIIGIGFVVFFRWNSGFPSELDRLGSDLNLYGYGIGVSFLIGIAKNRHVLPYFKSNWIALLVCLIIMSSLALYCLNMQISKRIRALNRRRFREGLETFAHLGEVLESSSGRRYVFYSLTIGIFPTLFLVILDLIGEK